MWHTKEISKIFIQIADDYGYDVFSNKKKCIALCGDLLAKYTTENSIFQMLFNAGLGETFSGAPYNSIFELKIGISKIEAFLANRAIESAIRAEVICTNSTFNSPIC